MGIIADRKAKLKEQRKKFRLQNGPARGRAVVTFGTGKEVWSGGLVVKNVKDVKEHNARVCIMEFINVVLEGKLTDKAPSCVAKSLQEALISVNDDNNLTTAHLQGLLAIAPDVLGTAPVLVKVNGKLIRDRGRMKEYLAVERDRKGFLYEKGDKLLDGSMAQRLKILREAADMGRFEETYEPGVYEQVQEV